MKIQIRMLDSDGIDAIDDNYVSSLLLHAYTQHAKHGDSGARTLQILLELQQLVELEIEEVRNLIIDDALSSLRQPGD